MHGKCMNMWHTKEIALWAQPNPNLPTHNQLHTSKMHDNTVIMLMWCNAWDFMIKSLKPIPKFQQKLNKFEKPQNFPKKPQILGFKTWNAWLWEIRNLPSEKKSWKAWRNLEEEVWSEWERFGVSERGLGVEKTEVSRERSTKMSCRSHEEDI